MANACELYLDQPAVLSGAVGVVVAHCSSSFTPWLDPIVSLIGFWNGGHPFAVLKAVRALGNARGK